MTNHGIHSNSSILRVEFLAQNQDKIPSVHQTEQTRMGNQQTKTQGQRRTRLLTSDRLAKQPFYTLLVLIRSLLPDAEKGPRGQLQSIPRPRRFGQTRLLLLLPFWHRSPTSWTFNSLEDLCVCVRVIFVISQYLQDIRTIGQPIHPSSLSLSLSGSHRSNHRLSILMWQGL